MTSKTKTLVEVSAIEATSKAASRVEMATYFATEPEAWAGVGEGQIVVHRLGDADGGDGVAEPFADERYLVRRVLGVAASRCRRRCECRGRRTHRSGAGTCRSLSSMERSL